MQRSILLVIVLSCGLSLVGNRIALGEMDDVQSKDVQAEPDKPAATEPDTTEPDTTKSDDTVKKSSKPKRGKKAAGASQQAKKGSKRQAASKVTSAAKARLPRFFGKLKLDETQRGKIYELQASYNQQLDELQKQILAIEAARDKEITDVLTAAQKKTLSTLQNGTAKKSAAKNASRSKARDS